MRKLSWRFKSRKIMSCVLLLLLLGTLQAMAQQKITGVVKDVSGETIAGANVMVKGTTTGTMTDLDGQFTLDASPNAVLQVSFIGYVSEDVKLEGKTSVIVILSEDTQALDEVVVVGYGSVKRQNLTSSVSKITDEAVKDRAITTLGEAFQGQLAGVRSSASGGGVPGEELVIRIRGMNTINGDSSPLYVIDGVPRDNMSDLNPTDIASIQILKDASATSIYGSRGANGVVLIETKQGQGKPTITFDAYYGVSTPEKKLDVMSGEEWVAWNMFRRNLNHLRAGGSMSDPMSARSAGNQIPSSWASTTEFTDWQDAVMHTAPIQSYQASASAKGDIGSIYFSAGYMNQEGIVKYSYYERLNARLNAMMNITKKLRTGVNVSISHSDRDGADSNGGSNGKGKESSLHHALMLTPLMKLTEGTRDWGFPENIGTTYPNPVEQLKYTTDNTKFMRVAASVWGEYDILDGLTFKTQYSYNYDGKTYEFFQPGNVTYSNGNVTRGNSNSSNTRNWVFQNTLSYDKSFKDHNLSVLLGQSAEEKNYYIISAAASGWPYESIETLNVATTPTTATTQRTAYTTASFFGRASYDYKEKYLLTVSARYDGSSRFPSGNRFGFFPSMSAGYRISEEPFMQSLKPYLSTLKIRGSWGMIGNQDVGTDRYISTLSTSVDSWIIDGKKVQSTQKPTIVSSTLTWEKVTTLDLGLDARFFNDALGVTFDWYNRTTSDILTTANLPATLGADAPYENMGTIQTKGWELAIDYRHTFKNGLHFGVTASVADDKTEVTKWTYNTKIPSYGATGWWDKSAYKEGMVLGDIWGLQFDRFLTEDDFNADGSLKAGLPDQTKVFPAGYQFAPGDVLYKDLDNNGEIVKQTNTNDKGDLSVIGNALPRLQFGLNLDAAWKGFDISMFFQGVAKRKLWAAGNQVLPGFTTGEPFYKGAEDYWTPENTDAFYPRPMDYKQSASGNYSVNDRYLLNMAYLRLKTFTVGYSLPKVWLSKFKVQGLRVYFTGENLFTIDGVKPAIDPEIGIRTASGKSDQRNFGRSYPYQKTVSFGIQLSL